MMADAPNLQRTNWDDLRLLVAVARHGTLRRAADVTGLSAATLSRRIDELEAGLGDKLLERAQAGCVTTPAGARIVAWAQQMEEIAFEIERTRDLHGAQAAEGTVRINTDEWMSYFLTTRFAEFHRLYPRVDVEIITSHRPFSLTRREADIAIRPFRPKQADLTCKKVGTLTYGLYSSAAYHQDHAEAISRADWAGLSYVGFDELRSDFPADRWLRSLAENTVPWMRCSYALGIFDGVVHGSGLGVLANFIAKDQPTLSPIIPHIPELDQEIWLSMHSSLRSSARVRAASDYIGSLFPPRPR